MHMMDWNHYRQQVVAGVGNLAKLTPETQPHARDEYRRHQTTSRGGPRVRSAYCCARRVTVQAAERGPWLRPD